MINLEAFRLDLTAANHAFLVEPQWNPMLEEQAMSRVHRLGQTKPVNLVRFIVKNTWEEKIVTVQERKRTLADMIIEGRRLKSGDDGRKQLMVCVIPDSLHLISSHLLLRSICVNSSVDHEQISIAHRRTTRKSLLMYRDSAKLWRSFIAMHLFE